MKVHLNQLKKIWLFEKSEQSEVMFIAQLMRASISVPDEMIIKQGDSALRIYFITMGKVQIMISQSLVDLRAGEIQKLMKMRRVKRLRIKSISRDDIKAELQGSRKKKSLKPSQMLLKSAKSTAHNHLHTRMGYNQYHGFDYLGY